MSFSFVILHVQNLNSGLGPDPEFALTVKICIRVLDLGVNGILAFPARDP